MIDKEYVKQMKEWRRQNVDKISPHMRHGITDSDQYEVDFLSERCIEQSYFDVVCGKTTYKEYLKEKPELLERQRCVSIANICAFGFGILGEALSDVLSGKFDLDKLEQAVKDKEIRYLNNSQRIRRLIFKLNEVKAIHSENELIERIADAIKGSASVSDKCLRKFAFSIIRKQIGDNITEDSNESVGARLFITKYTRITEDMLKVIKDLFHFGFIGNICCDLRVGDMAGQIIKPGFEFMLLSNQVQDLEDTALKGLTDEINKLIRQVESGESTEELLPKLLISREFSRQLYSTKYILSDDLLRVGLELPGYIKVRALYLFVGMYYLCLQYDKCINTGYEFKVSEEDTVDLFTTGMSDLSSSQCLEMFGTEWINVFFDILVKYKEDNELYFSTKNYKGYTIRYKDSEYKLDAFGLSCIGGYVEDDFGYTGRMNFFGSSREESDYQPSRIEKSLVDDMDVEQHLFGNEVDAFEDSVLKPSSLFGEAEDNHEDYNKVDCIEEEPVEKVHKESDDVQMDKLLESINEEISFSDTEKIEEVLNMLGYPNIGTRKEKVLMLRAAVANASLEKRFDILNLFQ